MNATNSLVTNLHFSPHIEELWLLLILATGALIFVASFALYRRGMVLRTIAFCAFLMALLNPSLIKEERSYVKDVAVIVVDESSSQTIEERSERAQIALLSLKKQIEDMNAFDLRVVYAPTGGKLSSRTDLFSSLDQTLSDVPKKRRAGVIFLTDGQIHDVPQDKNLLEAYGPVHVLLTGQKNEKDRQIVVTHAPAYGLVGKTVTVKYRIEDTKNTNQVRASVTLTKHDGTQQNFYVPVGEEQTIVLPLDHPSQNIFSLEVEGVKDEITLANNKTALIINGVRDRLRVMLISGIPHSGERTWRDLLTSDPGVDLVHFTILREPQKFDYTPKNELSLIAFPFRELFEIKLYDFDLIIFDRYRVNNILPENYFENIANFVREGGAFLEASGPTFANDRSIFNTPLGSILPGHPTGQIMEKTFKPKLTELGYQHPVTKSLIWKNEEVKLETTESWGNWLRYIDIEQIHGDALMKYGDSAKPLLLLDRVGQGRVAQLSSDHIWLWSRGYDGGGPHAELLRRIVHWLMKEPELDDRALDVKVHKNTITISKQNYTNAEKEQVSVTLPDGETEIIELAATEDGRIQQKYIAEQLGIYAFEDVNGARKFAIIGELNPPELRGVKTTDEHLAPLVKATKGATIWLDTAPSPKVSASSYSGRFGGSDWLSLKRNSDYTVTGIKNIPLLPEWLMLLILLSSLIFLWWREGQQS